MPLAVSIYPNQHRQDSTILPQITASGLTGVGFVKIAFEDSGNYFKLTSNPYAIQPPNKSLDPVPISLRQMINSLGNWTVDAGIGERSIDNGLARSSGEGFNGAIYSSVLNQSNCSIQATATSTQLSTGISLQNASAVSHNYNDAVVKHGIILGQNARGAIWEAGQIPPNNGSFKYNVGDTPLVEVKNGICRYYLVSHDGQYRLLRTTRSKLTENPKAEVILYYAGSALANVYLHSNNEAVTEFENIAVLDFDEESALFDWQVWRNPKTIATTADILQMADKTSRYTYPNQKRNLQSINLTPLSHETEGYWKIVETYRWHGQEREFIFVDRARKDILGEPTEFWAKFASPIQDSTINGCRFDHAVSIVEDYRTDYVPRITDEIPPTVTLDPIVDTGANIVLSGAAEDDILLKSLRVFINGAAYGTDFLPDGGSAGGNYSITISKNFLTPGINSIYVLATDNAGNTAVSVTRTVTGGSFLTLHDVVSMSDSISLGATLSRTEQVGIVEQRGTQGNDRVDITDVVMISETMVITPTPTTVTVTDTVTITDSMLIDSGSGGEVLSDETGDPLTDEDGGFLMDENSTVAGIIEDTLTATDVIEDTLTATDIIEGI